MKNKNFEGAKSYLDKRDYKMTIELDQGVHRCLHFAHEGRMDGHFRITTWPGHLSISGDMGTYVFSRTEDMIYFFSGDGINPCYWGEKLQSESRFGEGYKTFDLDGFIVRMNEEKAEAIQYQPEKSEEIADAFSSLRFVEDEHSAVQFIRELNCPSFDACDFGWPEEYTFHYLFACLAINWACNHYLNFKQGKRSLARVFAQTWLPLPLYCQRFDLWSATAQGLWSRHLQGSQHSPTQRW